ncbi:MAG TPA: hypothetical protein VGH19_01795 [Verrucomicrobiae bacterium]
MKSFLITLLGLFAVTVSAQTNSPTSVTATTNATTISTPAVNEGSVSIRTMQSLEQNKPVPPPPNEIKTEKGVYSGVLPQAAKMDNPLQLVNPAAPKEYGEAKDNTVFDPRTGQAQGIKLFSFSWFKSDKNKKKKTGPAPEPEAKSSTGGK